MRQVLCWDIYNYCMWRQRKVVVIWKRNERKQDEATEEGNLFNCFIGFLMCHYVRPEIRSALFSRYSVEKEWIGHIDEHSLHATCIWDKSLTPGFIEKPIPCLWRKRKSFAGVWAESSPTRGAVTSVASLPLLPSTLVTPCSPAVPSPLIASPRFQWSSLCCFSLGPGCSGGSRSELHVSGPSVTVVMRF